MEASNQSQMGDRRNQGGPDIDRGALAIKFIKDPRKVMGRRQWKRRYVILRQQSRQRQRFCFPRGNSSEGGRPPVPVIADWSEADGAHEPGTRDRPRHNVTVTLCQTSANKLNRRIDGITQPHRKVSIRPGTYVPGIFVQI